MGLFSEQLSDLSNHFYLLPPHFYSSILGLWSYLRAWTPAGWCPGCWEQGGPKHGSLVISALFTESRAANPLWYL